MTATTNPTILCGLCKVLGLAHVGDHLIPSPEQQDMTERFRPTDEQIANAVAALSVHPDWIAAVPLALPGKEHGWWEVGQVVEPVEGVWIGANSFDAEQSYADARNAASLAASAALGSRFGSVAYASVRFDGTWATFEDVRLDADEPEPEAEADDEIRQAEIAQQLRRADVATDEPDSFGVRSIVVTVEFPEGAGYPSVDDCTEKVAENIRYWLSVEGGEDDTPSSSRTEIRDCREVIDPEEARAWQADAVDQGNAEPDDLYPRAKGLPLLTVADVKNLRDALDDAIGYREDDEACTAHDTERLDDVDVDVECDEDWTVCPAKRAALYTDLLARFDAAARA